MCGLSASGLSPRRGALAHSLLPARRLLARSLPTNGLLPTSTRLLAACRLLLARRLLAAHCLLAARCRLAGSLAPTAAPSTRHARLAYVARSVDEVEEPLFSLDACLGDLLSSRLRLTPTTSGHGDARHIAPFVEEIEIPRLALDTGSSNFCCHRYPPMCSVGRRDLHRRTRPVLERCTRYSTNFRVVKRFSHESSRQGKKTSASIGAKKGPQGARTPHPGARGNLARPACAKSGPR